MTSDPGAGTTTDINGDGITDVIIDGVVYIGVDTDQDGTPDSYEDIIGEILPNLPETTPVTEILTTSLNAGTDLDVITAVYGGPSTVYYDRGGSSPTETTIGTQSHDAVGIQTGDFNGDGLTDIVMATDTGEKNLLFLNPGDGDFSTVTPLEFGTTSDPTTTVVVADIDGDNLDDIVIANGAGTPTHVYLQDPTTGIPTTPSFALPGTTDADTRSVAAGDIDGDGDNDIVLGNWGSENIMLENKATDSPPADPPFSETTPLLFGSEKDLTNDVALADLDGDGNLDVVVANSETQNLFYSNPGSPGFFTPTALQNPISGDAVHMTPGAIPSEGSTFTSIVGSPIGSDSDDTKSIEFGDMNGDGLTDVIAINGDEPSKYYVNDNGAFDKDTEGVNIGLSADTAIGLTATDMDGDGLMDLLFSNKMYTNPGSGIFTAASEAIGIQDATSVGVADLDGDGLDDLVLALPGECVLYLNEGTVGSPVFAESPGAKFVLDDGLVGSEPPVLTVADVDSDGDVDIVVASRSGENLVYENLDAGTGSFTYTHHTIGSQTADSRAVLVTDINNDGDLDIIVANYGTRNAVFLGDGSADFSGINPTSFGGNQDTTSIALADMDGDGFDDIIAGQWNDVDKVSLYTPSGGVGDSYNLPNSAGDTTTSIAVADLDGDGVNEVVVGTVGSHDKVYYVNQDAPGLTFHPSSIVGDTALESVEDTRSILVADFDGDGVLDVATGSAQGAKVTHTMVPTSIGLDSSSAPSSVFAFGDFDSDLNLDIVVEGKVFLNLDGTATGSLSGVAGIQVGTDPFTPTAIGVGDLDSDGTQDIIYGGLGELSVYYNTFGPAIGHFDEVSAITFAGVEPEMKITDIQVADLNNDGHPDLVVAAREDSAISTSWSSRMVYYGPTFSANYAVGSGNTDCLSLTLADMNGDGYLDIIATAGTQDTNSDFTTAIFLNPYTPSDTEPDWSTVVPVAVGAEGDSEARSVVVHDMNEDGYLDVVVGNYGDVDKIYLGADSVDWTTVVSISIGTASDYTTQLDVADLDGDGSADIVVASESSPGGDSSPRHHLVYYGSISPVDGTVIAEFNEMLPMALFSSSGGSMAAKDTTAVGIADLNGDGNKDVVFGNAGTSADMFLGVSVDNEFDYSAIQARMEQLAAMSLQSSGAITDMDVVVSPPVTSPDSSECRVPSEPYYPVQTKLRIEFPIVTCYDPECIILDPIEAVAKSVENGEGNGLLECNLNVVDIQREIIPAPPPLPPPPTPPPPTAPEPLKPPSSPPKVVKQLCYYVKWDDRGEDYRSWRPIFPVNTFPEGHPALSVPGTGLSAGDDVAGDYSVPWYFWTMDTLSNSVELLTSEASVINMPGVNAFYAYGHPYSWSANTGTEKSNSISMFFLQDDLKNFYVFYILDKAWDGTGGTFAMTLSATDPLFINNVDSLSFHDNWNTMGVSSTPKNDTHTPGNLPIMLRDDPWNEYTLVPSHRPDTLAAKFSWLWLECCTDGMIIGPLPREDAFNITFEAHCDEMENMDGGTRISMWHPDLHGAGADWNHYDVPMNQECFAYKGIQLSARECEDSCAEYDNCGECTAQIGCGWVEATGECVDAQEQGVSVDTMYKGGALMYGRRRLSVSQCCTGCFSATNGADCVAMPGCGWAPFENKCISGTPDYPCEDDLTVVQWEDPYLCYKVSYNDKKAFAGISLEDEHGVAPVTHYPIDHPKCADGVASDGQECGEIPAEDFWSETGAMSSTDASSELVPGAEAFYAYGYPHAFSSNTGDEASNCAVAYMMADASGDTFIVVLADKANDGSEGELKLDISTTGITAGDPYLVKGETNAQIGEHDHYQRPDNYTFDASSGEGFAHFFWGPDSSDGMIFGPLPAHDWTVNLQAVKADMFGVDCFKIGTYDAEKNDVGIIAEIPIKKATDAWGGVQFDGIDCTDWCQTYTTCSSCLNDPQCQFAPNNGGCVAAAAYVYDYGCARPEYAPITKLGSRAGSPDGGSMTRGVDAYTREAGIDGFNSTALVAVQLDRTDDSCPCSSLHVIYMVVYDANMEEQVVLTVEPRAEHKFTFVDVPGLTSPATYYVYTYVCIKQGTLKLDDCSPAKIDTLELD
jgi:hypothetical protein